MLGSENPVVRNRKGTESGLGDASYRGREFWWLGSSFRVLAPPAVLAFVPLSSIFRYNAVTLICQRVPVLDNMRARKRPQTHLWMSCLFNVPARELGPALPRSTVNCLQLYFGCSIVFLCWGVCMKLFCSRCLYKAAGKGGAITEGELDTPCLANTVLQLSKPVWPNIFNSDKSEQSQTREYWIGIKMKQSIALNCSSNCCFSLL